MANSTLYVLLGLIIIVMVLCSLSICLATYYYKDDIYDLVVSPYVSDDEDDDVKVSIDLDPEEVVTASEELPINMVTAFDKENYINKLTSFIPGKFVLVGKGNNSIASLQIPEGYEVHLYDDNNFQKELAIYKKDVNVLPENVIRKASSIHVKRV